MSRLTEGVFDVLIVGGGINGAASAAALSAAGASVALVDRGDFASETSQESSNLVWGGIKYLENLELGLVWKLCRARNELIRSYPTNVREIRFFAPLTRRARGLRRKVPVLYAGAWLYWLMGRGYTRTPRWLTRARVAREEPGVDASVVKGGIEYSDAYLLDNDARFVFGFVREAWRSGAVALNYVEVRSSSREGDVWSTAAVDRRTGAELAIRSKVLLNAAGPYVDDVNRRCDVRTRAHHLFSKGIHLVVDRVTAREHVLTFFDETDRMFFVLPMGKRSVIGTTDTRVETPETEVTDEDRRFLLHNVNWRLSLTKPLEPADVIAERCGVRPLVAEGGEGAGGEAWFSLSRKHRIEVDREKRAVSVFGGKLTDCVNVGEEVLDDVAELGVALPERGGRWYGEPPAEEREEYVRRAAELRLPSDPGGGAETEPLARRLWRRYGRDAFALLEEIAADPALAEIVVEGTDCRRCELVHAARHEMVVELEDFLRRRTKLALVHRKETLARAAGMMEACRILAGDGAEGLFDGYFGRRTPA